MFRVLGSGFRVSGVYRPKKPQTLLVDQTFVIGPALQLSTIPQIPSRIILTPYLTWRGRGLSKSILSRVIIGVTPFRVLITLLVTYLRSPLPLQVGIKLGAAAAQAKPCI